MIEIKYVYGHYEAYDENGDFLFSGDTEYECRLEAANLVSGKSIPSESDAA